MSKPPPPSLTTYSRFCIPDEEALVQHDATGYPELAEIIRAAHDADAVIEHIIATNMPAAVIVELAPFMLSPRDFVWLICVWARLDPPGRAEASIRAIRLAETWVSRQEDGLRIKAQEAAEAAGMESLAGWAAQATFLSGGPLTGPEIVPPVYPPEGIFLATALGAARIALARQSTQEGASLLADICLAVGRGADPTELLPQGPSEG